MTTPSRAGWHTGELLAIDFESTGVDATTCAPVTVALVKIRPGLPTDVHTWLVNPRCDIPAGATAIHGITTEKARDEGEDMAEVLDLVAGDVALSLRRGVPLVAFNASYDCTLLEATLGRLGLPTVTERLGGPLAPVLDPFVIDKHVSYRKGSRKLVDQVKHYRVRLDEAHDAASDAIAAARVLWRIAESNLLIRERTLEQLHADQVVWAAEQAASLQAYFRRQPGREAEVVDGTWPVRAVPAGVSP